MIIIIVMAALCFILKAYVIEVTVAYISVGFS